MAKEPRFTMTLRNVSINDVCTLKTATDPRSDEPPDVQLHIRNEIRHEFARIRREYREWHRKTHPRLYRQRGGG